MTSPSLIEKYQPRYQQMAGVVPEVEWATRLPLVDAIEQLKRERGVSILAHNYQVPEIYHGVADYSGDSLELARLAASCEHDTVMICGVHFMAESAKLFCPDKRVLCPDPDAGCSLAAGITAEDVRALREQYPDVPVVAYVNTTAAVKAEVDICCTSSNAIKVVESLASPRVIVLPDGYLARYIAQHSSKTIIPWEGRCEVHERFSGADIHELRQQEQVAVYAHPECSPEVIAEADFVGSTSAMINEITRRQPPRVMLLTECSMADNIRQAVPETRFLQPCNLCPYMKQVTLEKIHQCLLNNGPAVEIDAQLAERARRPIERMMAIG